MLGGFANYFDGKETLSSLIVLIFLMGVLPVLGGSWLIYTAIQSSKQRKYKDSEQQILKLAMQSNGRITTAQVATFTHLSLIDADTKLKELQERGILLLKITEEGEIVYQVSGGMSAATSTLIDV